ncbi:MAG: hypothetical protein JWQ09_102, partial [Segetibacter sp.]|nr:hypothetical protein [Segetibacter sp.]
FMQKLYTKFAEQVRNEMQHGARRGSLEKALSENA